MKISDISYGTQVDAYSQNTVISIQKIQGKDIQMENSSRISLKSMFKPLIKFFKISGIYFEREDGKISAKNMIHRVYCAIVILLIAADTVRFLTLLGQLHEVSSTMMGLLAFMCNYILSISLTVSFFISSSLYLPNFLNYFDQYQNDFGVHFNLIKTRKVLFFETIVLTIFSILIGVAYSSMILLIYIPIPGWSIIKANFTPFQDQPYKILLIFTIAFSIIRSIFYMIQFSIFLFYLHVSYCIYCEFKFVTNKLQKIMNSGFQEDIQSEFEHLRQQHESIKTILSEANKIIQHTVFLFLSTGIPVICFILYGLIHKSLPQEDMTSMFNIIILNSSGLLTIVTVGASVCSQAHKPLDFIYRIDLSTLPERTLHQIAIFTASLNGPPIGYNVYGLFVVDKSTILMLFGTIVTYSVVMLQFAPGSLAGSHCTNSTVT